MDNKKFSLESGTMSYDVIFADGNVAVSLIRKLKECRYDQVTKVVQKKMAIGMGDEISFRIFYMENGTEKTFPWVQARITAESTRQCLEHMKLVLPKTVEWIDQRQGADTDSQGRKVYNMQFLPFGYVGAGLPRGLQLWIYMIGLGVLIFPLIYIAKVLITGGYRIYTNAEGIEIKKFSSKKWSWNEIDSVDLTNVNVTSNGNISSTQVMKMNIVPKAGRSSTCVLRYDAAVPLLKEMAEHNLVSVELISKYA